METNFYGGRRGLRDQREKRFASVSLGESLPIERMSGKRAEYLYGKDPYQIPTNIIVTDPDNWSRCDRKRPRFR